MPGAAEVWTALPRARIVGGAVRDLLAARPVEDVDFAVPAPPPEIIRLLAAAGIRAVPTGIAHGTVTAVAAGRGFEITSLRRDVETDGRRALVAFTDDWEADAARRDFTINAMSMTQDGALHDYFGGADDLRIGRVRFVGEAMRRIKEDYLRILRFFRFFARYGKGDPDPEALAAITALRDGLRGLSAERVGSELKRILAAPDPRPAVALMARTGVLPLIFTEGADVAALDRLVAQGAPPEPLLRIAALLRGDPGRFAERLRLSGEEQALLRLYRAPNGLLPGAGGAALRRALADEPAPVLLARSWLAGDAGPGWRELRARLAATPRPVFPLRGRDILALGVPAGPDVGRRLEAVRNWWRQDGCTANFERCLAQARRMK